MIINSCLILEFFVLIFIIHIVLIIIFTFLRYLVPDCGATKGLTPYQRFLFYLSDSIITETNLGYWPTTSSLQYKLLVAVQTFISFLFVTGIIIVAFSKGGR